MTTEKFYPYIETTLKLTFIAFILQKYAFCLKLLCRQMIIQVIFFNITSKDIFTEKVKKKWYS